MPEHLVSGKRKKVFSHMSFFAEKKRIKNSLKLLYSVRLLMLYANEIFTTNKNISQDNEGEAHIMPIKPTTEGA